MQSSQESDKELILTICYDLLEALHKKDFNKAHTYLDPNGHACLRRNGTELYYITLPEVIEAAKGIIEGEWAGKDFRETVDNPQVLLDDDMAVVWASMRVIVDGNILLSGMNMFGFHKTNGKWLIDTLMDRNASVG
jgi:hypothetical protein